MKKTATLAEDEIEQMIQENYPKIYAYVYRRILHTSLAKDITQETFYHFFANVEKYEERGKLLPYLYRIAAHLIFDYTKSRKITEELKEELLVDHQNDVKYVIQSNEEKHILRKWMKELPQHLQEVIVLRFDEDLKFKDISLITNVNVSTVKSRVKLAIHLLQEKARKEGWK
ncbi:RNA polymerase sigma factor [Amedibacillus sp. YH-ame6]